MIKQEILEIMKREGLSPNKVYGQNFLINKTVTERIVESAELKESDRVLEIGPGLGELTEVILSRGSTLTSVEIDAGLFRVVRERFPESDHFKIIHADFLKTEKLGVFNKVIANLPYYCASEILFNCAEQYDPDLICVMIQKEMAERIVSHPGDESYGAMTVMLSLLYDSKIAFSVHPSSFFPQPDVTSAVVVLRKKDREHLSAEERELFGQLVKGAFWGRRKTLIKACSSSPHISLERSILLDALRSLGINDRVRGEALSVAQFAALARIINSPQGSNDRK